MFLTVQQKFILDALKKLGCVRRQQLHALVRGRFQTDDFETTHASMGAMLRQLRTGTVESHLTIRVAKRIYERSFVKIIEQAVTHQG